MSPQRGWKSILKPVIFLSLAVVMVVTSCRFSEIPSNPTPGSTPPGIPVENQASQAETGGEITLQGGDGDGGGLNILLSDGSAQPSTAGPELPVDGEALDAQQIAAILDRLPLWTQIEADQQDFRLPDEVIPPPRTGELFTETFPTQSDLEPPVESYGEELEVLRFAPEGSVAIAPFINVTFNQPMVPLDTLESLSGEDVPVQISPEVQGTWRWLGTKTVNFQAEYAGFDRLPMATEYQVTIPAGTESALGDVLAEAVEFKFQTPPPTMQNYYPSSSPQGLEPKFFVSFDQLINPDEIIKNLVVEAGGNPVSIRLLTEAEIEKAEELKGLINGSEDGRWLAFQADEPLPADTGISVNVQAGTPSAEGPLTTPSDQNFSFRTYAPLRVDEHGCSWSDPPCRPLTPLFIRFNNPLDLDAYQEDMLQIEPELPGASVNIYGNTININGSTKARTTYRVTISGQLLDQFGQQLGNDKTLRFNIGPAEPVLFGPQQNLVTLDPASQEPSLSIFSMNYSKLDVEIYRVVPGDWPEFMKYLQEYQRTDLFQDPPGEKVFDDKVPVEAPSDQLAEVQIPLDEYLQSGSGQFIVIAQPPRNLLDNDRYWETIQVWVQVTQIGLDAFVDHSEMVVWATDLSNGAPIDSLEISSPRSGILGATDQTGSLRFDIPGSGVDFLVASSESDIAFLPPNTSYWSDSSWTSRSLRDELRWYVFDDRGMYKPGEEVSIKGWLRKIGAGEQGGVELVGERVTGVRYQVMGPQGNELASGTADVNMLGGFDLQINLPENTNLGYAQITLDALGNTSGLIGTTGYHSFQIQEFRRPEFEVQARNESTGPYFVGDDAVVAVEARYYAGGPLPNAETDWYVRSEPTNYQPPNWPEFSFGYWTPWWFYDFYASGSPGGSGQSFSGMTDSTGNHYLNLSFDAVDTPRPYSVVAEATVYDVNRQAWTGTTDLMVHPADLYVGLRTERYFVQQGEPLNVEMIVTDLDGNLVEDRPVQVQASRLEWKYQDGRWQEVEIDTQECQLGSGLEPESCEFSTPVGGRYRITALVEDSSGRVNQSQLTRWVSGGEQPPARNVEREQVTLIPDQDSYQPGDTAEILVQAPFSSGQGRLTISRSGIVSSETFQMDGASHTLEIPIEEWQIPNLHLQVDLTGSAPRTDDQGEIQTDLPPRPAYASGSLNLEIPPLSRSLNVEAVPRETELAPGQETSLNIRVVDASGEPVKDAELAVVVVDEAILALSGYTLTDPLEVFYADRPADFSTYYSRNFIQLTDPDSLADEAGDAARNLPQATMALEGGMVMEEAEMMMEAPAADAAEAKGMGGGAPAEEGIQVRLDFNPLALFQPEVRTDAAGQAQVEISLPDNLTRYRIMVAAVDSSGQQFGSGEANLTARLPLMVRPSAPRFLNFGDEFEFPVVLQNQTDQELVADLVIQTGNLLLTGEQGVQVTVPADDRIEVRFQAAADQAGTARYRLAAVSGSYEDAAQGELPVYTPATAEAFATYGVVDDGTVIQPVASPEDVFPQFGGLEINTSSTALQALTDAVLYLVSYPYECSEQISSRILGVAALRDVLTAFEADGLPSPQELEDSIARDIEELDVLQNNDGGFPYWRRGQDSIPFNTIHTAHALQRAREKGFDVPENLQQNVLYYLQEIESHYPQWYSAYTRNTLSAYALYVRDLMGDSDPAKARNLFQDAAFDQISISGIGWIWQVLVDDPNSGSEVEEIRVWVNNRVVETPGAANFTTTYHDQSYLLLSSNRKTDAVLLDALMADNPESDLIPKLVNGLLAHRTRGRWNNTQENVFVLLAMDRYFNTFESQTPEFVARIWLGETYAGEHSYAGYSTDRHLTEIPMNYLVEGKEDSQNLIISKEGPGRLYYRLGLKYAPVDLQLDPLDMGFVVQRSYEAVDDAEDVTRQEDGTWVIKAGARVRVNLTMVADNRRYHVALVDPLPAGLEIINPALAVSGSIPEDPSSEETRFRWWWWTWYDHQNMRDERAEAFTPLLWDGVYEYSYVARATTPGSFVVPPAKAEEMYSPEVFGRSGSDLVIVR